MSKPKIKFHNTETDEIEIREMNDVELADYEALRERFKADALEAQAKATAKAALLERLGITEDEARLLLS